jgi:hypothetical protein
MRLERRASVPWTLAASAPLAAIAAALALAAGLIGAAGVNPLTRLSARCCAARWARGWR